MSDQLEPRWELLPRDPATFFRLSANFDLRDLKRAYSQLIRQFKPENYPNEFQRIRAAYESLLKMVRDDQIGGSTPAKNWPVSVDPAHSAPSNPLPRAARRRPLRTESALPEPGPPVEDPSPIQQYEQLKSRPAKSPGDYMTLALLSDLVPAESAATVAGESFVDWILAGLAEHPNDWGLTRLLREYLMEQRDFGETASLLVRAVEILPSARFQYVTQAAWSHLLMEGSFREFRECLQHCGSKLGKALDHSELVFYVQMLKLSVWRGYDNFLGEIREIVEDNYHRFDLRVQREYEIVSNLMSYHSRREEFIQLGPCCQRIDQAMRDWSLMPEVEGGLSVLECQSFINERGAKLLDEFPDDTQDYSYVVSSWKWVVSVVMPRLHKVDLDEATFTQQLRLFVLRAQRRYKRSRRYYKGLGLFTTGQAILFVFPVLFLVNMAPRVFAPESFPMTPLNGLIDWTLIIGFVAAAYVIAVGRKLMAMRYEFLRPELLMLIRSIPLKVDETDSCGVNNESITIGDNIAVEGVDVIEKKLEQDPAMHFFMSAQLCLHVATPPPLDEPENA